MAEPVVEPSSYRDPDSRVFYRDDGVYRGLTASGAAEWAAAVSTEFVPRLMAEGKVVATETDAPVDGWAMVLRHERVPFLSYPYEWTFGMLRDAARLHLEILAAALDEGFTMKDGTAYNVQWRGSRPVFVDVGSFTRRGAGGPWPGYRQFCQTFLYPLLVQAHKGVPFHPLLRGRVDGITTAQAAGLLAGRDRWRKGVLRHVHLHRAVERRAAAPAQQIEQELSDLGFNAEVTKATVRSLAKLVDGLRPERRTSPWTTYRDTCTYSDDDRAAKEEFVDAALGGRRRAVVWDLGANDGTYARRVAAQADWVVAIDADEVTLDTLYGEVAARGPANLLPLVVDLTDPSPGLGWRGRERRGLFDRGEPDFVLCLALVHHLTLGAGLPLAEVVAWLRTLGAEAVVEFVHRDDPMAQSLLSQKPPGTHDDYDRDEFERLLAGSFVVAQQRSLPSGSRTLYLVRPR